MHTHKMLKLSTKTLLLHSKELRRTSGTLFNQSEYNVTCLTGITGLLVHNPGIFQGIRDEVYSRPLLLNAPFTSEPSLLQTCYDLYFTFNNRPHIFRNCSNHSHLKSG